MTDESGRRFADVVVIGAGQAGLSAAYHLQRRRFSSALEEGPGRSFIVLDQEDGPGGAWRHRWDSLVVGTVNGIHDLPGMAQPDPEDWERSNVVLPRYFGDFERKFDLPILRPVRVQSVERVDDDAHGMLAVHTDQGDWTTRAIINATGTWRRPLALLPGTRQLRGPAVAHRRLRQRRGVPGSARGRGGWRDLGGAAPGGDLEGHHQHLGDPPGADLARG